MRFSALLKMTRVKVNYSLIYIYIYIVLHCFFFSPFCVILFLHPLYTQLLGRTINLRSLITERMNKVFRENLEFLFDRFESQDLCAIVVINSLLLLVLYQMEILLVALII